MNEALPTGADQLVTIIGAVWTQITSAPAHLLLVLILNVLGYALKKSPVIPNQYIPIGVLVAGTFGYPLMVSPGSVDPAYPHPQFILHMYGFLLGALALIVHRLVLRRFGKFLNGLFCDDPEDTNKTP